MLICMCTVGVMALTVASVVVAGKRGLFDTEKTGDEDFVKPKKMLGWSLVIQMTLASAHLLVAAAGFYTGANLEKAVCQPGRSLGAAENVIDYADAMPGHEGVYLSDVLLGNGTIGPLKMADVLTSCGNGSAAYSTFLHHLMMPNVQSDLQNYTQHFGNLTEVFDRMRVSLPDDTTLVPPEFVNWVGNFTLFNDFNYTLFDNMLNGQVINADIDTYTANLQVIYDSGLPFEPSKSRLPSAIVRLQSQKTNLSAVDSIKNSLATIFNDYTTAVSDILATTNQTMEELISLEPALINMSGDAISKGVDQYYSEFIAALDNAANRTWQWVGEAAPCEQLRTAYDVSLTKFCDQYSDYVNASWLLLGHTCLFLLTVSAVSLCLYRAMPDPKDNTDDPLDVDARTRILMIDKKNKTKDSSPIIAINTDTQKPHNTPQGTDNHAFSSLLDDVEACASPAPASTVLGRGGGEGGGAGGRFQKGGRTRRISSDAWIDSRPSAVTPGSVVLQKNVMSMESLA
ncbi:uncharacterized protein LOC143293986 [Babylonia areolata]|uniref:uncharacterized protein LOC143293986 n=1 Tax=Babylonia areolata TaxID=304850 RepID=UPI003FD03334